MRSSRSTFARGSSRTRPHKGAVWRRRAGGAGTDTGFSRPKTAMPSSGSRLPGIEGLRAIAAGSILIFHGWRYGSPDQSPPRLGPLTSIMPHLSLGVILFFCLSGFLLYRPFAAAVLRATPGPGIRTYLRNRVLRILPAYWVILFVTGVVLNAALLRDGSSKMELGSLARQPVHLAKNVALVHSYDPQTLLTGIGPAWSLVIEVAFYATLPLLAMLAVLLARKARTRGGRRLATLVGPLVLLALGLLGKVFAHFVRAHADVGSSGWGADWYSVLARSFLTNADLFVFGMLLAVLHTDLEDGLLRLPRWWRYAAAVGAGAVALAAVHITSNTTGIGDAKYDTLMTIPCGLLLAIVVLPDPTPARHWLPALLDSRPLVAIGLVSYSLFLWHEPLAHWLREQSLTLAGTGGLVVNLVVLAIVTGLLSWLTYRYVEVPAMSRRRRQAPTTDLAVSEQDRAAS
jgi:peptidoglycan/LPS O-acetylase OafA/YrhL